MALKSLNFSTLAEAVKSISEIEILPPSILNKVSSDDFTAERHHNSMELKGQPCNNIKNSLESA